MEYGICRSLQALSSACLVAEIGVDKAENVPFKVWERISMGVQVMNTVHRSIAQ